MILFNKYLLFSKLSHKFVYLISINQNKITMKTLRFLKVHLIMFIAIIISGSGCSSSSDDPEPKPQEEAKLIPIHIGFTGEITSITDRH